MSQAKRSQRSKAPNSRTETQPAEAEPRLARLCRKVRRYGRLECWLAALDTYGVQLLILDKERDATLLQLVRSRPGWTVDFEDNESVLFTRSWVPQGARVAA